MLGLVILLRFRLRLDLGLGLRLGVLLGLLVGLGVLFRLLLGLLLRLLLGLFLGLFIGFLLWRWLVLGGSWMLRRLGLRCLVAGGGNGNGYSLGGSDGDCGRATDIFIARVSGAARGAGGRASMALTGR